MMTRDDNETRKSILLKALSSEITASIAQPDIKPPKTPLTQIQFI